MSEHEYLSCVEALESGVCLNREQWRCLLLGQTEDTQRCWLIKRRRAG